jgi:arylsulfatase A-like enzyme
MVLAAAMLAACSKETPSAQLAPQHVGPTASGTGAQAVGVASASPSAAASAQAASAASAASASASAAAPKGPPPGPPKDANVVVISIDSMRADMPWNGYARPIAPRLTDLEKQAVSYTHAYSISSYTSMSLGGFLGGRLPSELTRSGYFFGTYKKDVFFPKLLKGAGVHTMGVMAHMYFNSAGFDQGFDEWKIVPGIKFDPNTDNEVTSERSEQLAEQLLGESANDTGRFFFWAHFLDPHDQYMRHEGIDWGRGARDRYDGEVTFTDRFVGKLLDFIATKPWAPRTVILVTSDHGEEFGEHGMTRHGFEVWQTLVRVPLMVIAPGATPRRVDVARSAIDLAPTILEFLGVAPDPSYEGKSLVPEVYGAEAEARDVVVDLPATSNNGKRRALVHDDEKIICFDGDSLCKLYDLEKDPQEQSPVTKGDAFQEMRARYQERAKAIHEVAPYACGPDCLNNGYLKKGN